MAAFLCRSCRAPLDPEWVDGTILTCRYCRVAQPSPFPARTVLARLDPTDSTPPGFTNHRGKPSTSDLGPEMVVSLEGKVGTLWHALTSHATFDDFEVRVSLRLLWGDLTTTRAGVFVRTTGAGFYSVLVSTQQTLCVSRWIGTESTNLHGWAPCDALRAEPGAPNELRVRAAGDRISVAVNGQHTCVLRDSTHRAGTLVVASRADVPHAYAIRSLVVEALDPADAPPAPAPARPAVQPVASGRLPRFVHAAAGTGVAVVLTDAGKLKINAIKAMRELTGLGLKDAKDAVERAPTLVGHAIDDAEAARWIAHLAAAGARAQRG